MKTRMVIESNKVLTQEFRPSDGFMAAQWVTTKVEVKKKPTDRMRWHRIPLI